MLPGGGVLHAPGVLPLTPSLYQQGYPVFKDATCIPAYAFCTSDACVNDAEFEDDITLDGLAKLKSIGTEAFAHFQGKLTITGAYPSLVGFPTLAFWYASNPASVIAIDCRGATWSSHGTTFQYFDGRHTVAGESRVCATTTTTVTATITTTTFTTSTSASTVPTTTSNTTITPTTVTATTAAASGSGTGSTPPTKAVTVPSNTTAAPTGPTTSTPDVSSDASKDDPSSSAGQTAGAVVCVLVLVLLIVGALWWIRDKEAIRAQIAMEELGHAGAAIEMMDNPMGRPAGVRFNFAFARLAAEWAVVV
jgi:hypothetical protein